VKTRLYVAAVIGGLALLVVTVVIVANFGRHDPSPPSLRDDPNPAIPGSIIYLDEDQCIVRADASGQGAEEVYCLSRNEYVAGLYYVDATTILLAVPDSRGLILRELDTTNRAVRDLGLQVTPSKPIETGLVAPSGEEVFSDYDGSVVILKDGTRTTIAEFDTRNYGGPSPVTWSPDGQWILLRYWDRSNTTELWIISRDGATQGTLTEDASGSPASWLIEGVGTYPPLPDSYQR
jgi:WD40 repeat protein